MRNGWRSALVKSSPPYDPACQKVPDNDVRSGRSPHSAARQPRGSGSFAVNRPSPVLPDTAHPVRPSAPAAGRLHYGLRRHNASERQRRGKAGLKYPQTGRDALTTFQAAAQHRHRDIRKQGEVGAQAVQVLIVAFSGIAGWRAAG